MRSLQMLRALFALAITVTVTLSSSVARADTFTGIMNNIVRGTPGITNVAIGTGVTVGTAGAVDVAASGLVIPVATSVAADVSAASIALGAGRVALRALPWVGVALTVGEVAKAIADSDITVCPPPKFFCKPGPAPPPTEAAGALWVYSYNANAARGATMEASCAMFMTPASQGGENHLTYTLVKITVRDSENATCTFLDSNTGSNIDWPIYKTNIGTCPAGTTRTSNGLCQGPSTSSERVAATEDDLQTQLNKEFQANHDLALKLKQQMDAIAQQNPGLDTPINYSNTPVRVTAPEVTSDPKVVSTTTLQNPDGTTSTQTVTTKTVVTPVVGSPATVSAPNVSFPSTSTTTTTVVNNSTNVTNQTTTVTNNPSPTAPVKPSDFPNDYNREATQKAILQQLDGTGTPDAPDSQEDRVAAKTADTDKSLADKFTAIPTAFVPDKANWFSWVWTPPVAECSTGDYSGTVHGWAVSFDICPWVGRIREALGFIFAIFGALSIYTNIFKRGD